MTRRVLGVDGCPTGWVCVALVDGVVAEVEVVTTLAEVLTGTAHDAVGVDMPIGLVDGPRQADAAARTLLPGRASSVFSAPPRAVVEGARAGTLADHAAASAAAVTCCGVGISMQAWRLVPRIIEVDGLVASHPELHEVHPEVAFALLVGDVLPRKRSWAGVTTRRAVLERYGLTLPDRFPGDTGTGPDDVLDAAVCAFVADAIAGAGEVVTLPDRTDQRDHNRPITITARVPPPVVPGPGRPRRTTGEGSGR